MNPRKGNSRRIRRWCVPRNTVQFPQLNRFQSTNRHFQLKPPLSLSLSFSLFLFLSFGLVLRRFFRGVIAQTSLLAHRNEGFRGGKTDRVSTPFAENTAGGNKVYRLFCSPASYWTFPRTPPRIAISGHRLRSEHSISSASLAGVLFGNSNCFANLKGDWIPRDCGKLSRCFGRNGEKA